MGRDFDGETCPCDRHLSYDDSHRSHRLDRQEDKDDEDAQRRDLRKVKIIKQTRTRRRTADNRMSEFEERSNARH